MCIPSDVQAKPSLGAANDPARSGRRVFQPPPRSSAPAAPVLPPAGPSRPQPTADDTSPLTEDSKARRARQKRARQERRRAQPVEELAGDEVGASACPGFQTAKSKLVAELRQSGDMQTARELEAREGAPIVAQASTLRRAAVATAAGAAGGNASKFLPPYVKKALQSSTTAGGSGGEDAESALSERTLSLLRLSEFGRGVRVCGMVDGR